MIGISKKERLDHEPNNPDLLSNLPLSIIHDILALIPIGEAVRTCILSRQWRYKWVTLPYLVFKQEFCPSYESKERMESFITNVLVRHEGPIYKFQMSEPFSPSSESVDQWMLCLSRNDVKELIIDLNYNDSSSCKMHSSIYSCKNLTNLVLYNCVLDPPPSTFNGFLFLRGLHLYGVYLVEHIPDEIETVFANSPILEKLEILDSDSSELCMYAPNLKSLSLRGEYKKIRLYAPLLAEMEIALIGGGYRIDYEEEENSECKYTYFLGGFSNLERFTVGLYAMKYLRVAIGSRPRSLVLPHLKLIDLGGVNYKNLSDMLVVARLIAGAPNLENLTLNSYDFAAKHLEAKVSFMDFRSALNSRFEKLRVVKMSSLRGYFIEMEFIKYLLENSPVLQVISFGICDDLDEEEKQVLMDLLLHCTCASPVAKISAYVSVSDMDW